MKIRGGGKERMERYRCGDRKGGGDKEGGKEEETEIQSSGSFNYSFIDFI